MKTKGLVYVFTGTGKGKTSAALGVALRTLLIGKRVSWISWYKEPEWPISEKGLVDIFPDRLSMYWMGEGFYLKGKSKAKVKTAWVHDKELRQTHEKATNLAMEMAERIIMEQKSDLIVLDEVIQAIHDKLIPEDRLLLILKKRKLTNMVLTGRGASNKLIDSADLVTEMKKIKHQYDQGILAVRGLDY